MEGAHLMSWGAGSKGGAATTKALRPEMFSPNVEFDLRSCETIFLICSISPLVFRSNNLCFLFMFHNYSQEFDHPIDIQQPL